MTSRWTLCPVSGHTRASCAHWWDPRTLLMPTRHSSAARSPSLCVCACVSFLTRCSGGQPTKRAGDTVVVEVMEVGSSRVLHGLVAVAALSDNRPITVPLFQSLAPHAAAPTLTLTRHPWVPLESKTVRPTVARFVFERWDSSTERRRLRLLWSRMPAPWSSGALGGVVVA